MADDPEAMLEALLKARRAVIHGLANSLAVLSNNLPPLAVHVHARDGIATMVDLGANLDQARDQFQTMYEAETIRRSQINRLASTVQTVLGNLQALRAHVTSDEGLLILAQMQTAADRGRAQFEALRQLL